MSVFHSDPYRRLADRVNLPALAAFVTTAATVALAAVTRVRIGAVFELGLASFVAAGFAAMFLLARRGNAAQAGAAGAMPLLAVFSSATLTEACLVAARPHALDWTSVVMAVAGLALVRSALINASSPAKSSRGAGVEIVVVAAVALNGVIGCCGALPWRAPSDLRRFRDLTLGRPVIMGRRTFESLPVPLRGREVIVVTRDGGYDAQWATRAGSLSEALALATVYAAATGGDEVVVAGGGDIYSQCLPISDRMELSLILSEPDGDAMFPEYDESEWDAVRVDSRPVGPRDDVAFLAATLVRRPSA